MALLENKADTGMWDFFLTWGKKFISYVNDGVKWFFIMWKAASRKDDLISRGDRIDKILNRGLIVSELKKIHEFLRGSLPNVFFSILLTQRYMHLPKSTPFHIKHV